MESREVCSVSTGFLGAPERMPRWQALFRANYPNLKKKRIGPGFLKCGPIRYGRRCMNVSLSRAPQLRIVWGSALLNIHNTSTEISSSHAILHKLIGDARADTDRASSTTRRRLGLPSGKALRGSVAVIVVTKLGCCLVDQKNADIQPRLVAASLSPRYSLQPTHRVARYVAAPQVLV